MDYICRECGLSINLKTYKTHHCPACGSKQLREQNMFDSVAIPRLAEYLDEIRIRLIALEKQVFDS